MYLPFFVIGLLVIASIRLTNKRIPPPTFGIYQYPGKWYYLKMAFIYCLLHLRRLRRLLKDEGNEGSPYGSAGAAGYGFKSRTTPHLMDCRQTLSTHPKAIDAVYFNLANKDGWNLVVGTALRPHGVVNGFLYLNVPHVGLYLSPKLPDTLLFQERVGGAEAACYSAEGITLTPIVPMRSWRIEYRGKMKSEQNPSVEVDVEMNGVWTSHVPFFDYDTDMDPTTVARAMATEPWTAQYFQIIQDFHQTHYEQHGHFSGTLRLDGESREIRLDGVRDHSYGRRREWKSFHRYGLHFIDLEDGTSISVGVVCAPSVFSRLELGYLCTLDGNVVPVRSCDLRLDRHGERGRPPSDYAFSFRAGSEMYRVQVEVQTSPEFFVGWQWEARVVERLARFKVNGVAGWGAAEWEYRHVADRPHVHTDPLWTRHVNKG